MREAAKVALARLDAHLPLEARVGDLPVAQRQIVAICRGLAANARLLFMDEPTASLTRHEVDLLLASVRRLKEQGVAIVFVSHRLEEVVEIAERVTVLRDGQMVGTFAASEIDDHRLAELMTGNRVEHNVTARSLGGRNPVLEVRGASRAGEFEDVSFTLHEGEVLGLTGLLGAGRTELALALFGMNRLEAGELRLNGQPLQLKSNQDAITAGIAYLSEDRLTLGLNLRQPIADNIALSVLDRLRGAGGLVPRRRREELADTWVERLKIKAPDVDAAAQTLSGGNQQRIVLAKWLATDPKVLILDSPTVGVDIRNKQGIYDIVRQLAQQGVAILLISDEIGEVSFNCDRVLHMRGGRIVGDYVPGQVAEEKVAEAVYA
jgi:simple sugar transport system ATP-binding protein